MSCSALMRTCCDLSVAFSIACSSFSSCFSNPLSSTASPGSWPPLLASFCVSEWHEYVLALSFEVSSSDWPFCCHVSAEFLFFFLFRGIFDIYYGEQCSKREYIFPCANRFRN
uniref:Putative secreted protein n=1 Tax=Anopheles triannulatus TaxID=58253 RepID=A0A2M4B127_9DIPT